MSGTQTQSYEVTVDSFCLMTINEEKEILEIQKLKADISKMPLEIEKMVRDMRHSSQRNVLLTVAVTTALVSAYFKFLAA
ncbi:hypothetical protein JHD49_03795 [Sulfurimonas sp. SAG-AH-194-C21]|nr:hypothetical protein [Sulfurimonas sp. SAG-AH-194-C21]MDF1883054.1 hypothetical protein [Sulfurimonas sp. SAG-AH-194-C21]